MSIPPEVQRHRPIEDVLALCIGILLISLGVQSYVFLHLLTGSTAGMAFLAAYSSGMSFGVCFFIINLPFYILAIKRMGWLFTLKTFAAISALSLSSIYMPRLVQFDMLSPLYGCILGGCLMGVGFLILFRHGFSLGGINILALYCQKRYGISTGKLQMSIDLLIMAVAFFVVEPMSVLYSLVGAVLLNMILMLNFKSSRYVAFS